MKTKNLIILAAVVIAVLAYILLVERHRPTSDDARKEADKVLRDFDWQAECRQQADSVGDSCDAGLGLVVGDGHVLHICPDGNGKATVHFHYPRRKKWFEVLSSDTVTKTWQSLPMEKAEQMVETLFKADYEVLREWA